MPSEPEKLKLISVDVVYYEDYKTYVAECMELPIVIEADTIQEIQEKMPTAIDVYRKAYPDKSEMALKTEMVMPIKVPEEKISGKTFIKMAIPAI
jgi:predicted RNase H-like HicB family nuclease